MARRTAGRRRAFGSAVALCARRSHIARPQLAVWRPAVPRGHGVLIAAGGGYRRIEMAKEAGLPRAG
jgi:hypothetical protein